MTSRNKVNNENQNPNFCFRKLQFENNEENEDIFFSTQESRYLYLTVSKFKSFFSQNFRRNQVEASGEFMTFSEQIDSNEFKMHCGPQETPDIIRNRRELSSIKRSATCNLDDLLMNVSRSNSNDIFNLEPNGMF